jgi:hypothetical protein
MSDYLLLCNPEEFAKEFPDVDPVEDLGFTRSKMLGQDVLLGRYFLSIRGGQSFPGGYDRDYLGRHLPLQITKSNKHHYAREVLSDEHTFNSLWIDWVEYDGKPEEEFYLEPEHIELRASIEARKASAEYKKAHYYLQAFAWFAQQCEIIELHIKY